MSDETAGWIALVADSPDVLSPMSKAVAICYRSCWAKTQLAFMSNAALEA